MRWRYVLVVGGVGLAWLIYDLWWAWWEDHQAIDLPPDDDSCWDYLRHDRLMEWPGCWRDTSE